MIESNDYKRGNDVTDWTVQVLGNQVVAPTGLVKDNASVTNFNSFCVLAMTFHSHFYVRFRKKNNMLTCVCVRVDEKYPYCCIVFFVLLSRNAGDVFLRSPTRR